MFQPKKKPGVAVVIAMKGKNDPESPEPIEQKKPNPFASGKPAPAGYRPKAAPPADDQEYQDTHAAHEAAETPEYEAAEEYGAKLIQDIDAVAEQHGMDQAQGRMFAADLFGAIAECLRRDSSGDEEAGEAYPDNEKNEYPA